MRLPAGETPRHCAPRHASLDGKFAAALAGSSATLLLISAEMSRKGSLNHL